MKAYVAGPFPARQTIACRANDLEIIGYTVRAPWLHGDGAPGPCMDRSEVDRARWAREDLEDVAACDVFVMFLPLAVGMASMDAAGHTGGRHIETGYALAHRKHVVIVGGTENVFHSHPGAAVIGGWPDALTHLAAWRAQHHAVNGGNR